MFNKVQKNAVAVIALVGSLIGSPLLAAVEPMQGSLVPATPYDGHMAQAGIFFLPSIASGTESAESLFAKARTFRYQQDTRGEDYWQTPEETEAHWSGDCEDKAIWLFAQLKKNGFHDARLVIGRLNPSSRGFHVWVALMDKSGGSFYVLDPTAQKRIWRSTDFSDGSYRPLYSFDGSNRYRHDA